MTDYYKMARFLHALFRVKIHSVEFIFGMHVKMYQNAFYVQKKKPTLIYIIFVIKVTCSDFYEPSSNVFTYYLYDTHERYFVLFVPFVCKFMVLYWLTDWLCLWVQIQSVEQIIMMYTVVMRSKEQGLLFCRCKMIRIMK